MYKVVLISFSAWVLTVSVCVECDSDSHRTALQDVSAPWLILTSFSTTDSAALTLVPHNNKPQSPVHPTPSNYSPTSKHPPGDMEKYVWELMGRGVCVCVCSRGKPQWEGSERCRIFLNEITTLPSVSASRMRAHDWWRLAAADVRQTLLWTSPRATASILAPISARRRDWTTKMQQRQRGEAAKLGWRHERYSTGLSSFYNRRRASQHPLPGIVSELGSEFTPKRINHQITFIRYVEYSNVCTEYVLYFSVSVHSVRLWVFVHCWGTSFVVQWTSRCSRYTRGSYCERDNVRGRRRRRKSRGGDTLCEGETKYIWIY